MTFSLNCVVNGKPFTDYCIYEIKLRGGGYMFNLIIDKMSEIFEGKIINFPNYFTGYIVCYHLRKERKDVLVCDFMDSSNEFIFSLVRLCNCIAM